MKTVQIGKVLVGVVLAVTATAVAAQDRYPDKPIHVIVPYPAGGIIDVVARAVTRQIGSDWNQSFVIDDQPGASSNIGTANAARSKPDGYTWLLTGPAVLVNPSIYGDTGWEPMRDFKTVGVAVWNQSVAVVPSKLPVKSMKEFVQYAKAHPGAWNFGNPGVGSSIDLTAKKLFHVADIKLNNIGYKGQPPALVDLIGDRVQFEIVSLELALPHIKAGTLRPLATFTHKRIPDLPNVPTIAEAGYPKAAYVPWYGFLVPAKTPQSVVNKIHEAINKSLSTPAVHERLAKLDQPGQPMTMDALAALMNKDHDRLTKVVKVSGESGQ